MLKPNFSPDYAVHPGETLKDTLEAHGITQKELSNRTGISEKHISQIIQGIVSLSPETALKLEKVFGIRSDFWNNYQKMYDDTMARLKAEEIINEDIKLLPEFRNTYTELTKHCKIKTTRVQKRRVSELHNFYGVSSLQNIRQTYQTFYRKGIKEPDFYSLSAWMRIGERKLKKCELIDFSRKKLLEYLPVFRELTKEKSRKFISELEKMCADAGLLFIYFPYFKKSNLNGVARWIGNKPVIQISDRNKYQDIFWFSFFHELGHILKHGTKNPFLEFVDKKNGDELEQQADKFAQDKLIPSKLYKKFIEIEDFSDYSISLFAEHLNIDQGIVAGRLAWNKYVAWSGIEHLRRKM